MTTPAGRGRVVYCQVTGNPCGTDTWVVGHPCECGTCYLWLRLRAVEADKDVLAEHAEAALREREDAQAEARRLRTIIDESNTLVEVRARAALTPPPTGPTHGEDCAVAVNPRHDCTCEACATGPKEAT